MQRFVKTLRLNPTPEAVEAYKKAHDEIWPEIVEGIRQVGVASMELYRNGYDMVMIMEVPDNIDVEAAMNKLSQLPRQSEWEEYVGRFQQCNEGDTSADKWHPMELLFTLKDH